MGRAHCDGPITRAGKDAVFSGQALDAELERALRDLDAKLRAAILSPATRFRPPTACCCRFFASARNSRSPPTRRGSGATSTARVRASVVPADGGGRLVVVVITLVFS